MHSIMQNSHVNTPSITLLHSPALALMLCIILVSEPSAAAHSASNLSAPPESALPRAPGISVWLTHCCLLCTVYALCAVEQQASGPQLPRADLLEYVAVDS